MSGVGEGSLYQVRVEFDAPLEFVYRWCTDYSSQDPKLEKDEYTRRLIRRSRREVVYEDLSEAKGGWMWSRMTVTLRPPDRWHAEAFGSHRTWRLDYTLRPLGAGRTELTLRGRRRPTELGGRNPPKARLERELAASWANFARALRRDYHREGTARSHRRG
ncbi:MAG TPA: hypothetical protein VJQ43_06675 [Thermoplasmata archaeon]|nr:hypothetical protein [Thermoplasmata archaeon]